MTTLGRQQVALRARLADRDNGPDVVTSSPGTAGCVNIVARPGGSTLAPLRGVSQLWLTLPGDTATFDLGDDLVRGGRAESAHTTSAGARPDIPYLRTRRRS